MHTLTAIIRAQKGSEALVYNELLKVGAYARDHEPDTIGFFVAQDTEEPCVFTTYERFIEIPRGEPDNFMSDEQFLKKFNGLCAPYMTAIELEAVSAKILSLEKAATVTAVLFG